jgi:HEAT repeat protein
LNSGDLADKRGVREWIRRICSAETSDAEALKLFQTAYARDPRIEALLLERAKEQGEWLPRVLRLLAGVSDGKRLVAGLLPLLQSEEASVRELAVLLIARGRTNPAWALEMMKHPDPRIRANVIEGIRLWSRDMHVLDKAVQDSHHRVVCSGIVSMYRLRPDRARPLLEQQITHEDWQFRAAAAWACGAIGLPELEELVVKLRTDQHASVRWNALRAATAIRRNAQRDTAVPVPSSDGQPESVGQSAPA